MIDTKKPGNFKVNTIFFAQFQKAVKDNKAKQNKSEKIDFSPIKFVSDNDYDKK